MFLLLWRKNVLFSADTQLPLTTVTGSRREVPQSFLHNKLSKLTLATFDDEGKKTTFSWMSVRYELSEWCWALILWTCCLLFVEHKTHPSSSPKIIYFTMWIQKQIMRFGNKIELFFPSPLGVNIILSFEILFLNDIHEL